ncbi:uncharacterized protein LOC122029958 [Zingiber officinale]|uniref:uncharacterized protein LOC122029958 n=1 Tax=Zingiber officinale TaxID=94328 RepID=UPI001C4BA8BA|nr:uncharacterized protein LOC122029958 [Zingiber officinale]
MPLIGTVPRSKNWHGLCLSSSFFFLFFPLSHDRRPQIRLLVICSKRRQQQLRRRLRRATQRRTKLAFSIYSGLHQLQLWESEGQFELKGCGQNIQLWASFIQGGSICKLATSSKRERKPEEKELSTASFCGLGALI